MKEKLIGIYAGPLYFPSEFMHTWDERNLVTNGIGGSEIWAIQLASQFEKSDEYHAIIFADCDTWHFAEDGVEYIPYKVFNEYAVLQHFDVMIISRYPQKIKEAINADKIYLMSHEGFFINANNYNDLCMNKTEKICVQSDYHKDVLKEKYKGLKDEDFFFSFQAIPMEPYNKKVEKKNKMLWSSHKIRGARFLIERVLPLIRKEVPDFEIDVCGYINDMTEDYFKNEGVNVLGCIPKSELIEKQLESKIWIYPNLGYFETGEIISESFCITGIENAMAENAIILAGKGCFPYVFNGYSHFSGTDLFPDDSTILPDDKLDDFAKALAETAIKCLKDEAYRLSLVNEAKTIASKYTWENVRESWIKEINSPKIGKDDSLLKVNNNYSVKSLIISDLIETDVEHGLSDIRKRWRELSSVLNQIPNSIYIIWSVCVSDNIDYNEALQAVKANINPRYGWIYNAFNNENAYEIMNGNLNYACENLFNENTINSAWVFHSTNLDDIKYLPQIIKDGNTNNLEGGILFKKLINLKTI